jgi:hypothetical protein
MASTQSKTFFILRALAPFAALRESSFFMFLNPKFATKFKHLSLVFINCLKSTVAHLAVGAEKYRGVKKKRKPWIVGRL